MNLGEKINKLRKEKGYTQDDLAAEVGVTRQTISKWELSDTSPDITQAQKLASIFGVSLDSLVNDAEEEKTEETSEENKEEVKDELKEEAKEILVRNSKLIKYLIVASIIILFIVVIIFVVKNIGNEVPVVSPGSSTPGHHGFGAGHD